jgi:hypothetical protein
MICAIFCAEISIFCGETCHHTGPFSWPGGSLQHADPRVSPCRVHGHADGWRGRHPIAPVAVFLLLQLRAGDWFPFYCLLTDDSMLPLFLRRLGGDLRETVRVGDRFRGDRRNGFVRAPPTNLTRRGAGFCSFSKSDAARRSSGV